MNEAAYVRLHCELSTAGPEFELLAERSRSKDERSEDEAWVTHGRALLEMAERDLKRGAIDEAWRHLNTAKRFEIYGLEKLAVEGPRDLAEPGDVAEPGDERDAGDTNRTELEIRATAVLQEALDTLDGWRRRAVVDLLCDGEGTEEALRRGVTGAELRVASRILHEQYESVYLGRSERQRQFNQLVLMGALSGLTLLSLTAVDWIWASSSGPLGAAAGFLTTPFGSTALEETVSPGFAVFMTVAGVMGASLFGMRSLRKRSPSTSVPQQISQVTVTSARGVIGAISALLFYFVLQTPLLHDGTILADNVITPALMVVVGFAAGYTERMAPEVVARVASITDTGTDEDRTGGRDE
jgi:hypothetical protein